MREKKKNFDNKAIEVIDDKDNVILQVELDEEGVRIRGDFYCEDGSRTIVDDNKIILRAPKELRPSIKPIFVYPSKEHPGERVSSKK